MYYGCSFKSPVIFSRAPSIKLCGSNPSLPLMVYILAKFLRAESLSTTSNILFLLYISSIFSLSFLRLGETLFGTSFTLSKYFIKSLIVFDGGVGVDVGGIYGVGV